MASNWVLNSNAVWCWQVPESKCFQIKEWNCTFSKCHLLERRSLCNWKPKGGLYAEPRGWHLTLELKRGRLIAAPLFCECDIAFLFFERKLWCHGLWSQKRRIRLIPCRGAEIQWHKRFELTGKTFVRSPIPSLHSFIIGCVWLCNLVLENSRVFVLSYRFTPVWGSFTDDLVKT